MFDTTSTLESHGCICIMYGYECKQHFSFCKHKKVALAKLLKLFALWFF